MRRILEEHLEANLTKSCILLGDWNARVGGLGNSGDNGEEETCRPTKDAVINDEGKELVAMCEDYGLTILNGNTSGDWEGGITHVGYRSQAVLDYGLANLKAREQIVEFKVGNEVLSDHFPLELVMKDSTLAEEAEEKLIHMFTAESIERYKNNMKTALNGASDWTSIASAIKGSLICRKIKPKLAVKNPWWNENCYKARRLTIEELKKAKTSACFSGYRKARKDYKEIIKQSKINYNERFREKLHKINCISDGWKFIQKHTKKKGPSVLPSERELTDHFMRLLGGYTQQPAANASSTAEALQDRRITFEEGEFERLINSLKKGKAAGTDRIEAEALIYADDSTRQKIKVIMEQCMNGYPIPEEWRDVAIFPLLKKGDPSNPQNYRGISIVNSGYKLYANILLGRLERFVEDQDILPDCQNGFRKQRSTIDNIYILNHAVQKCLQKKEHLYTVFVDFKAAFDTVNRTKLFARMRKVNIPEYLIEAIKEIYRRTDYICGKTSFTTATGLRQGCPLSPILFALYISDLDVVLQNWQSGGVVVGSRKLRMLAYADDIVLMATSAGQLKDMIGRLVRYSESRDLKISTEKTKVLRFSGNGIKSTQRWSCGLETIEEVKVFKYLGFTFQSTGKFTEHLKDLAAKGKVRLSNAWSIGENLFPDNFRIRSQLYYSLVEPAMTYGCELFGLVEKQELETIQRSYFKWVLGLAKWTKTAYLMAETNTTPVVARTIKRALQYETKAKNSPCVALRDCVEEVERWDRTRNRALGHLGFSTQGVTQLREDGRRVADMVAQRALDQFRQSQELLLRGQTTIKQGRLPTYLGKGRHTKLLARFRLHNEERGRQSWRQDRSCRVCGVTEETLDHLVKCKGGHGTAEILLDESGVWATELQLLKEWRDKYVMN